MRLNDDNGRADPTSTATTADRLSNDRMPHDRLPPQPERSLGDLLRELRDESTTLLREEVALAKTEITEKTSKVGRNVALAIAGALVAHLGLIFLLLALSEGLTVALADMDLPFHGEWIAPLVVGTIVGGIGVALMLKAKKTIAGTSIVPEKTIHTLKEDKQWVTNKAQ